MIFDDAPDVTVVMPVWRADPGYLRAAIQSVLDQSLLRFELIVVEDPSDRPAKEIVAEFGDPRVRYVGNEARTSIVDQHNLAVSLARSEVIARFDADDLCERNRLERQKQFLDSRPEVDVVGCQLTVIDAAGEILGMRRYPTAPDQVRSAFRRFNPIANPGVMFRRRVVEEHGGWTPGSNGIARDYAWFSALAAAGVVFANIDEPLVRYRLHGGALKQRKLRDTARTTYEVKRAHWFSEMTFPEKALMVAERLVTLLPPRLVLALFRRMRIEPTLRDR